MNKKQAYAKIAHLHTLGLFALDDHRQNDFNFLKGIVLGLRIAMCVLRPQWINAIETSQYTRQIPKEILDELSLH